jgi:3-deoxy-D-manno-octulosonic-acid transferase
MLVDIAQTCQDNFPFALIAKRHNQPIQKVFDIFSAVVQIPLLRSAVDARRSGKLGSLRMKEFGEMKKNVRELHKDEKGARKRGKKVKEDEVVRA